MIKGKKSHDVWSWRGKIHLILDKSSNDTNLHLYIGNNLLAIYEENCMLETVFFQLVEFQLFIQAV